MKPALNFGLALCLLACAKVAEPQPPLAQPAAALTLFHVIEQAGNTIQLVFQAADVSQVLVFRSCDPSMPPFPGDPLLRLAAADVRTRLDSQTVVAEDPQARFDQPCRYVVRYRNSKGRLSPPSQSIQTDLSVPAARPEITGVEVTEKALLVHWDPPDENADGSRPARFEGFLVNEQTFVTAPPFSDTQFEFGTTKTYRVQSVTRRSPTLVVSELSEPVTVTAEDTFPPAPPQNLSALQLQEAVQLVWDENTEGDLAGYVVYRGNTAETLEKLSPLISINSYTDRALPPGPVLYYQVTALDQRGNESFRSQMVTVTFEVRQ